MNNGKPTTDGRTDVPSASPPQRSLSDVNVPKSVSEVSEQKLVFLKEAKRRQIRNKPLH